MRFRFNSLPILASLLLGIISPAVLFAQQPGLKPDEESTAGRKIFIKGSDTLGAKMVPQLVETWKELGKGGLFEIAAEGSSSAFTNLLAGSADIGMSSRPIKTKEKEELEAAGLQISEQVVAYDMIAIIINRKNPVEKLSLKQVEGIFTGDITNWKEVGGNDRPISVYTRNTSSGIYKSFQQMAMAGRAYGIETQKMAGGESPASEVSKNEDGISYVGLAYSGKVGTKPIPIDGVAPTVESAPRFPITRSLFFYTTGTIEPHVAEFISWVKTDPKAHEVIARVGFIPLRE